MTLKAKLTALVVLLALFVGAYYTGYVKGWYAHSDKVNGEYAKRTKGQKKLSSPANRKRRRPASKAK